MGIEPIVAPSAYKRLGDEDILHVIEGDTALVVIHAMPAREKFLR